MCVAAPHNTNHNPQKRKNKTFADGVLEVKDGVCTLYSHEGKTVCKSKLSFKGALDNGVCLVVGGNDVEIDEPLSPNAFSSGSCFMNNAIVSTHAAAAAPLLAATGFKRVKPLGAASSGSAAQPLPRPMHDPHAPDALVCNQPELVRCRSLPVGWW